MIILRLLLLLTNLHLKLLSTQGTGADKLLSTQRVKPLEKYQHSPSKKIQSTRKTSFSTNQESLNHHEKASTPTLEKFSTPLK